MRTLRTSLRRWRRRHAAASRAPETPLRAKLYSSEQMQAHGRLLAQSHRLRTGRAPELLLARLKDNQLQLQHAVDHVTEKVHDGQRPSPAAEWLLDNYYLIQEQISVARRHLPAGYSRELPILAEDIGGGMPRVYDLAMHAVAHGDGRVDEESLVLLLTAYQEVQPLRLGELWAIPIMLRLALLENLRRIARRVVNDTRQRQRAGLWAQQLLDTAQDRPQDVVLVVADMARSNPPASSAFVAELVGQLRGRGAALAMPMEWIAQWLDAQGHSVEGLLHQDRQRQAKDQASVRNSIGSLRLLATTNWRGFVERLSLVEAQLGKDPDGTYPRMDFATRDRYRHAVERLAKRSGLPEQDVAACAAELAAASTNDAPRRRHVGFYLIDDGVKQLRSTLMQRGGRWQVALMRPRRFPLPAYILPILLLTAGFALGLLHSADAWWQPRWLQVFVLIAAVIAFSEMATALVNWAVTQLVRPRTLPRLDFSVGVPAQARTLVVVPTLIGSIDTVDELVDALEVRYLGNRDQNVHFALLTDFMDAPAQVMQGDEALLQHARARIEALNRRHSQADSDVARFFLLHRPRQWNPREGCWMAHERKRGKLAALNHLLGSGDGSEFMLSVGDIQALGPVRYVITLDTDTQLPRDAARELIGTMEHPLNRPLIDPKRRVVVRGYGILQPAVGSTMSGGQSTRYARVAGTQTGIDPYTRMVSDVYQDMFGQGSFTGKGIYDIDAFEATLHGRIPADTVLSHDLLEGCYARSGLSSAVRLYEDYPSRYASDVRRRARWTRGDWQLLPWLLPWVRLAAGGYERNPLSWLSRGKIADNLRRGLVPAALLALLLVGWWRLPDPVTWTLWILLMCVLPVAVPALRGMFARPVDRKPAMHLRILWRDASRDLYRALVAMACMPAEAASNLKAIVQTLWRMLVTRRHLLQWDASHEVERRLAGRAGAEIWTMLLPSWGAGIAALWLALRDPSAAWVIVPWAALWLAAPWLMAWLGRPPAQASHVLDNADRLFLRAAARRIWMFFETLVGPDDHWLPPDNLQVHPAQVLARRTSPTNIGLALLANLSAHDFGYLQQDALALRVANTLETLDRLERFRGHLYNWYDTATLRPLPPRYISAVDSGNLAGHLLVLRQGLLALIDAPVLAPRTFEGLADTASIVRAEAASEAARVACDGFLRALPTPAARPATAASIDDLLRALLQHADTIVAATAAEDAALAAGAEGAVAATLPRARDWASALQRACSQARAQIAPLLDGAHASTGVANGPMPSLAQLARGPDPALAEQARARISTLRELAQRAAGFAEMDQRYLFDRQSQLLAIGYNVDEHRLDEARYDLLASEARLGCFVAIAQGQLPQESWFALGRLLTSVEGEPTLLSWSGSMFEYLMPQLVMPAYPESMLAHTVRNAVQAQIRHGRQHEVPWGVSESGYSIVDAQMNYQYHAFGVASLGLKRGLGDELVIAPYASLMAVMVAPEEATANLRAMERLGFSGPFGFYEAIDYTPARLPTGQQHVVVRSWMAHHQGMALLALDHALHGEPMQQRFMADPELQSALLLLQERVPQTGTQQPQEADLMAVRTQIDGETVHLRIHRDPDMPRPAVQLLSNGRYHALLSSAGSGYSRHDQMAVTRWRADPTCDSSGQFCYLRDVATGAVWSGAHQPVCAPVDHQETIFSDAKAEFRCRNAGYDSHLEIAVSAEDDTELRRLRITNRERQARTIEITTYAEVVLASQAADQAHPAFGNLFVQTEIVRDRQALLCTRRPRDASQVPAWMTHLIAVHDGEVDAISYETDRARFIGRGRSPRDARAMHEQEQLSDSAGSVLDPIVAIRCRITLAPDQTVQVDIVTGVADSRQKCEVLIDKYRDRHLADRVFDLAWTHNQVVRRQINATAADAQLFDRMAGLLVYPHRLMRADPALLRQNLRSQAGLWELAVSGDLPIVLLQISDPEQMPLVRQMVQAHAYWRAKGLVTDLVIWNEGAGGYRQQLQDEIHGMLSRDSDSTLLDRHGGVFVRASTSMSQEVRVLLQAAARLVVRAGDGELAAQLTRSASSLPELPAALSTTLPALPASPLATPMTPPAQASGSPDTAAGDALFDNQFGAFSADGSEYRIRVQPGMPTPAPWANVIANAHIGCVVSERNSGYSWYRNAHGYRLTPWHDDPVADPSGEAWYLRDEDSGRFWSLMPGPCAAAATYEVRHGFGYSVYACQHEGIASEAWVFVGEQDAVKYVLVKLRNLGAQPRRLSVTGYVEWVLGEHRESHAPHVVTRLDRESGLVTARNAYNIELGGYHAFFDVDTEPDPDSGDALRGVTCDRTEFIGRNGSLADPAALGRAGLSGRYGPGLDPCTALQVPVTLAAGQEFETAFRLGAAADAQSALDLALRSRGTTHAQAELDKVRAHWRMVLGTVQVRTPEPAVDLLVNGWLMYQVLSSRYLGRSGYYQSGGAFGFRDQLQDTMASVHAAPRLTRAHLLECAAHQFRQGDVLHWWHPPAGRGVRTHCSDDYLWLVHGTCRYVEVTGDGAVLDEPAAFIEGRLLGADEESWYDLPTVSAQRESLYGHCCLALRRAASLRGERGLPLMAGGDWNDGMDKVGAGGRGESVWLAFFLHEALQRFAPLADARGDSVFASWCRSQAEDLAANIERHAWDGQWYRRAWFDNGTALGTRGASECAIDSISQSWSVLSGVASAERATSAMDALDTHLVRRDAGLVQLLDPPFDGAGPDPGYIRGYVPGVRENGGQYTHAAVWAAMAFAELGDSARAWELARMINPIGHAEDAASAARYKVEPYVLAADVYAVEPHQGRGGWTWYTGSAGWMYRLLLESLLGLRRHGDRITLAPRLPTRWDEYRIDYRFGDSGYRIHVRTTQAALPSLRVDGTAQPDVTSGAVQFALIDDGADHDVILDWPAAGPAG